MLLTIPDIANNEGTAERDQLKLSNLELLYCYALLGHCSCHIVQRLGETILIR